MKRSLTSYIVPVVIVGLLLAMAACPLVAQGQAVAPSVLLPAATTTTQRAVEQPPQKLLLTKGDRVVIIGDSITAQLIYSRYIEDYLLMCVPQLELSAAQLGRAGEQAMQFLNRIDRDLVPQKPTVVTICYGMNDGGYRPFDEYIRDYYTKNMTELVKRVKATGARVIVGSPGAVDTFYYNRGQPVTPDIYNNSLAQLGAIGRTIAAEQGEHFANLHDPMMRSMAAAKAAAKPELAVCGLDGVHPGPNGHLLMAAAFLKAMGFDGDIGTITIDLKGQSKASAGHKVISAKGGAVTIESTRYPFCFLGGGGDNSARSMLPYCDFNQKLNRLTLVVKGLGTTKGKVTWGSASKTFTRQQLEAGINLADEFLDNPFTKAFEAVDRLVAGKQAFETTLTHSYTFVVADLVNVPGVQNDAKAMDAIKTLQSRAMSLYEPYRKCVQGVVKPVTHTITVTPQD